MAFRMFWVTSWRISSFVCLLRIRILATLNELTINFEMVIHVARITNGAHPKRSNGGVDIVVGRDRYAGGQVADVIDVGARLIAYNPLSGGRRAQPGRGYDRGLGFGDAAIREACRAL